MPSSIKVYRVYFERNHIRWAEKYFMDVFAHNKKEACQHVLEVLYYDSYHGHHFYPFHRQAERIDPDARCQGLRRC